MSGERRLAIAVLAHPDDEIGLYPWLAAARAEGRRVLCVWLTDGGWGGQDVQRRCDESRRVLSVLGLEISDMHFAGADMAIPDGDLHLHLDDAVHWLLERFDGIPCDTPLWIPAWEGGHPDHDAAHLAGQALARARGLDPMQYPLYHGKGLRGPWFRVLSPIAENGPLHGISIRIADRARCILRCSAYRSQWKSFVGLVPFYALRMLHPMPFVLQNARWSRTASRPHLGAMLYERRSGLTWDTFAAATARWRASTPS